ncbi:MAG: TatD family hydrolase [Oscillospiraceae bacterium]|nr:TatD family hydrolase [Oscillospiraceae bacterium]
MGIIDTHAHYLEEDFGEELFPLLDSMPSHGIEKVIAVGYDLRSSREEIALAHRYSFVYAAAGVHPENCYDLPTDWSSQVESMMQDDRVCALGEIGLDYHYDNTDKAIQAEVFEKQLELAKKLSRPVIIHSRDACEDTMNILKKHLPRGVLHCFSGSAETAAEVVKLGMYVGFTGVLTFKNAKKALAACEAVPLDRLLLETDCPYMAPVPYRGKRCDSTMLRFTAEKMAEIKGVSTEELIKITKQNAETLFGI